MPQSIALPKKQATTLFLPPQQKPKKKVVSLTPGSKHIKNNMAPPTIQKIQDNSSTNISPAQQIVKAQKPSEKNCPTSKRGNEKNG